MRYPKKRHEAKDEVVTILNVIDKTNQRYKSRDIVSVLVGNVNALIKSHRTDTREFFGVGSDKEPEYWMALLRQVLVARFLRKDIETYGIVKLTDAGQDFLKSPVSFMMTEDHSYKEANDDSIITNLKGDGNAADQKLFDLLKAERKSVANKLNLPPFVIFQDPSLEDMALKYPITMEELSNVHGVGEGKAKKYGTSFVSLITNYVDENDILRPDDFIVKSTGINSALKLYIIQSVDRKLSLDDIAAAKGLDMPDFIKEMEAIVYSGTKLNINYWIEDILDEDQQEEIHEYFIEAESDKIDEAMNEFDGDYDVEELRLFRIKFISEVAN
jgi:ATP-dependent DNA helicase RecQ